MRLSKFRTIIGMAITIISLVVVSAFAQQNPRELFERARMLDESNQNLSEAIKLYSQVVSQANDQRVLAAKAQYRIGMLYERLGRKAEAQRAFQIVVNQYADQAEVARRARAKIPAPAANGNAAVKGNARIAAAGANGKAANGIAVRQVWAGRDVDILGAVSPEGQYLSFTDWETGDLAIREVATAKKRRLTNKGSWFQSTEFAIFPTISPDSKQVAYTWFNKDQLYELRITGGDGSNPRVLYRNEEVDWLQPADWSSDGKQILALFTRKDRTNQIVMVAVADRSVRVLKTLDWRSPQKMNFSPDGRYVVYDFPQREDSLERDIFLLATDGSREIPLVKHMANDLFPFWTPDGKHVLFASDRRGTLGTWIISVAEGKPQGTPEMIKPDVGRIFPMGFTRKGDFYYGLAAGTVDVYVAEVDIPTGKVLAPPTPVGQRFIGSNTEPDWSPDGKHMAYVSQRISGPAGPKTIVIRHLETGEEREISPKMTNFYRPRWSSDGRSFLVEGADKKGRYGVYRVDAQTGDVTAIMQNESGVRTWSYNDKAIFYTRNDPQDKSMHALVRDLETGQEKELYRVSHPNSVLNLMPSPDGRQLAFRLMDQATRSTALMVMPMAGGEPRELLRLNEPEVITGNYGNMWTPDGRYLIFGRGRANEQKAELWRISVQSGEPQRLPLAMENLRYPRVHPDGRRVALIAGQPKAEVWVMENFLPAAQTRKASISRR